VTTLITAAKETAMHGGWKQNLLGVPASMNVEIGSGFFYGD